MLTRGEAASRYEDMMDILINHEYYFHTTDGNTLKKGEFTYEDFIGFISKIEYLDSDDTDSYSRYYVNPVMRFLILLSISDISTMAFHKISFSLVELVYEQLRISVSHGYRLALDDVRKNVANLFKEDRSLSDIK